MARNMRNWVGKDYRQKIIGIVIVLFVAGLGVYLLKVGRAASPYAVSEAEKGTLNSSACLGSSSNDSNGSHVQFGNCSTSSTVGKSANNIIIWTSCNEIEGFSSTQLAAWKSNGIAGFSCDDRQLYGMGGGSDEYTSNLSDPNLASTSTNPNYADERGLISTNIVAKAHAAGLKMYLGTYLVNYSNTQTPLEPWFDDSAWANTAIPDFTNLAGAAHALGFDGIEFDGEMYAQTGNVYGASWGWNGHPWAAHTAYAVNEMINNNGVNYVVTSAYTSGATFGSTDTSNTVVDTHTQAQVDAEVTLRGQQMMTAINAAFPNVQILDYWAKTGFPNTWDAYIQQVDNGTANAFAGAVYLPFWDGLTSVSGYGDIYFMDATFYKGPNISGATSTTLTNALQYNANSWYAVMSQNFSNWAYAADHVAVSPFIWVDGDVANEGPSSVPLTVPQATTLMNAYTQWGMDGSFADYAYEAPGSYDYSSFYPLFQSIAKSTVVDTSPPTLTVSSPSGSSTSTTSSTIDISGSSTDNFAVRDVKWTNSSGNSGAAKMTWVINSGDYTTSYNSQTNWTITGIPLQTGSNTITITVEDIHGLKTSKVITVTKS